MPHGGRLILRVGWAGADDLVVTGGRSPAAGRRVQIEVEDSGMGIAPEAADRVFNPFFSTKESGTGLGLALTHKMIEDHGGLIDFRAAPSGGTIFRIALPLFPDPPSEAGTHGDELR